jgi:hypothetical protein
MNQFQSIAVRPFAGGGGQTVSSSPDGGALPLSPFEQARAMMKAKYGSPEPQSEPTQPLSTQPNQAKG